LRPGAAELGIALESAVYRQESQWRGRFRQVQAEELAVERSSPSARFLPVDSGTARRRSRPEPSAVLPRAEAVIGHHGSQTLKTEAILAGLAGGKSESKYGEGQTIYSQGDPADCVFFIQAGRVKVAAVSPQGKEAVVGILQAGDFCGEECLAGHKQRIASVVALTECMLARLEKAGVRHALGENPAFSKVFISYIVARTIRVQEDLVDQLLNSTERRLARLLLILANFGQDERPGPIVPKVSQKMLAEMIGTSRTHVNFFMNKFRQLGFVDYDGGNIKVHSSLLNMLLHDRPWFRSRNDD
jgi:CRP/FNR family cyclic AMP-dependent transcriptional regulator